jgi:hypothetical protein
MARSKARMTAVPTALVAAAGRLPTNPGRRHHRKRRSGLTIPKSLIGGRSHRDVMKLARTAAAAVSAITVVMDVASELTSHKEDRG